MSKEVKEIAEMVLELDYGKFTELARGIGEITIDDAGLKDVANAVGGLEKLRDAIFYWAENANK